jgi:flagellin-like hook-associated protein FlgL
MNGDGSLDVVVVNQGGRSVSVLVGNGDGTFKAALSTSTNPPVTGAGSWGMDVGDVNGDGILDVVTGNRNFPGAGSVSVMIGRGDGTFNQATTMSTAADTRDVELADLNGDGNLDIISADFGDDQISIFLGNGNGTFQSRISMTLTDGPIKPLAEDINNDGKLDLIVANLNDGTVNIFIGNGDGTFQTRRSIGVAGAINVITGDLNEDGFIDMFVSGTTSGVLLGNGNGTFASIRTMSPGSGAWGAALGDLNSDGVLDIAVGVSNSTLSNIFLATTKDGIAAINPFSLSTLAEARQAISLFKGVADRLSEQKGSIGAFASRIKTSTEVLKSTSIAYQAAESRITDIDIAEETSKMIRQQILQQVSASILSQSKLQSEIALQLLR